ncbi:MAG TPA: PQQ-binding-like beta-propeller repeat protein [Gemmataceae bacterium]|nr:PQQ-binding-like beta-propeller repeat protein [Gemmataceae bacterium]
MPRRLLALAALPLLAALIPSAADTPARATSANWAQWRGPSGQGYSDDTRAPLSWSETENLLWKTRLPGSGHSTPIVWGDRVFLTAASDRGAERYVLCVRAGDGKVLWQKTAARGVAPERSHVWNGWASPSCTTDGQHVYAFFGTPGLFCYDMEGKLVWKKSPGEFHSRHGFCSSPLLYKDMVIFNGDQDAVAYIVALDQATGEERWRTDRPNRTRSYVPPVIFEAAGRPQMVLSGSKCVASYDPDTGKQIWIIDGPTEQFVASMVYAEGIFFITGGFPDWHVLGIKPDGQGNVTETHILWRDKGQDICSYVPSPVAWGSHFFIVSDVGNATCFDAKTGKRMWKEKLGRHHSASPVAAGGYLYFPDDNGITYVVKAGPSYELVSKNEVGENCYASPALSRGRIYLRTAKSLFCIGEVTK